MSRYVKYSVADLLREDADDAADKDVDRKDNSKWTIIEIEDKNAQPDFIVKHGIHDLADYLAAKVIAVEADNVQGSTYNFKGYYLNEKPKFIMFDSFVTRPRSVERKIRTTILLSSNTTSTNVDALDEILAPFNNDLANALTFSFYGKTF